MWVTSPAERIQDWHSLSGQQETLRLNLVNHIYSVTCPLIAAHQD